MTRRRYLLDTDSLSQLVREPQGPVAARIAEVGERRVFTSIIAACALRFGAAKRGSKKLTRHVEAVLGAMEIAPVQAGVDRHYAAIRTALERKGTPIGANDMLIAAHARALGAVCVTGNVTEFKRVPSLRVENWLQRGD
jgi:tRNA(fMet)-specific endonuclease VapC